MNLRIAGIGSRDTPEAVCESMIAIGKFCAENRWYVTSGHAPGADYAFEKGALQYCVVYLPWAGFNGADPILGRSKVVEPSAELDAIVYKHHPAAHNLGRNAFSFMRRNGAQVLGVNLDKPVDAVVYYRVRSGGTDQAIRIATAHGIPVLNMAQSKYDTYDKVRTALILLASGLRL